MTSISLNELHELKIQSTMLVYTVQNKWVIKFLFLDTFRKSEIFENFNQVTLAKEKPEPITWYLQ